MRQFELDQSEIYSRLRRAEIDVALTYDLDLPSDLTFEPILEMPPFVLVNEAHPLATRDEVDVADLDGLPMVLLDLPFSSEYFLSTFKARDARPMVVERTRDLAVMRSLVANGYGYSIANIRPLNDISPDGKTLKFLKLNGDIRPLRMGLLTAADAHSTNVVRAFSDHCRHLHDTGQFLCHGEPLS
ncbi:MAG: LysR substrate-binding domain-containing protein [Paracoccaceae bacterium]